MQQIFLVPCDLLNVRKNNFPPEIQLKFTKKWAILQPKTSDEFSEKNNMLLLLITSNFLVNYLQISKNNNSFKIVTLKSTCWQTLNAFLWVSCTFFWQEIKLKSIPISGFQAFFISSLDFQFHFPRLGVVGGLKLLVWVLHLILMSPLFHPPSLYLQSWVST